MRVCGSCLEDGTWLVSFRRLEDVCDVFLKDSIREPVLRMADDVNRNSVTCPVCSKVFESVWGLNCHTTKAHTGTTITRKAPQSLKKRKLPKKTVADTLRLPGGQMAEELVVDDEFEEPLETTTDEVKLEEYELGNTDFDYVLDESDERLDVQTVTQRAAERSAHEFPSWVALDFAANVLALNGGVPPIPVRVGALSREEYVMAEWAQLFKVQKTGGPAAKDNDYGGRCGQCV